MARRKRKLSVEEKMKELTLEQYGTDDLTQFAPGHLEWIEKEAMSRGD